MLIVTYKIRKVPIPLQVEGADVSGGVSGHTRGTSIGYIIEPGNEIMFGVVLQIASAG